MIECPKCLDRYSPTGGGHCMECHRTFTGQEAADAHRTGPFHPDGLRRCIPVDETPGWRRTHRGWTNTEPMSDAERARLAGRRAPDAANSPIPVLEDPA